MKPSRCGRSTCSGRGSASSSREPLRRRLRIAASPLGVPAAPSWYARVQRASADTARTSGRNFVKPFSSRSSSQEQHAGGSVGQRAAAQRESRSVPDRMGELHRRRTRRALRSRQPRVSACPCRTTAHGDSGYARHASKCHDCVLRVERPERIGFAVQFRRRPGSHGQRTRDGMSAGRSALTRLWPSTSPRRRDPRYAVGKT